MSLGRLSFGMVRMEHQNSVCSGRKEPIQKFPQEANADAVETSAKKVAIYEKIMALEADVPSNWLLALSNA